ncbi:exo-beta-N-acetylmuramidase NamZ domain-containing protein [Bacillus sp. FJAT-29814]|uniref:exo-beta-N-acetylmuramidase NamZ family protein n=1 Tax=Bacillus sp. FJAT-29814 TaxID=1729688 RepID=UPI000ABFF1E8|nr:DUF1343 domain-containing protein [Bacillus sp. FJAT-29814]
MKIGLDVFLEKYTQDYKGKRIGLVTNMTGVNQRLTPTIDLFHEHPDLQLTALYGPEHGIRGDAKEGEKVESSVDPYTNVPVYSLYGASKKPSKEMLDPVDVVFFDLQDIGARYYTYIYTMAYMMETCAEYGKQFVVLDRPNPISGAAVEGNFVEEAHRSFVGLYPIPNRHGLTVGEMALLYKHEFGIDCDLAVIPMEGWNRELYYDETGLFWVPPSPNTTGIDMAVLYPGTCLVEGTNLSEGRGTTRPFEYVGAPFIDGYRLARAFNGKMLPGVLARAVSFMPTYQKHKDTVCEGVQLHVTDRRALHSLRTGLTLLELIAEMYPNDFHFVFYEPTQRYMFNLLSGTDRLQNYILNGEGNVFLEQCEKHAEAFKIQRKPYLLY